MNVFLRELRAHRNGLIFWSIAMIFTVVSGIAKFSAYQTGGQSLASIVDQFPKTMQTVFGLTGYDLSTASGFYGVLFLYIVLVATVHAVLLGSEIIAKEERDKTSEFLFARPISRSRAITAKLSAGLINLVVINIVTLLSSLYFINYFTKGNTVSSVYILMLAMFILQLIFFSIGSAFAGVIKKRKASASIATSVLLVTLILMFLINLNSRLEFLKYLSPFKYFEANAIQLHNSLNLTYVVISAVLIVISIFITYFAYSKRDLNLT